MKSITSKLSIIILSLAAMAFTFVLGSTSSKAVSDETGFAQCVANARDHKGELFSDGGFMQTPNTPNHWFQLAILKCAQDNQ